MKKVFWRTELIHKRENGSIEIFDSSQKIPAFDKEVLAARCRWLKETVKERRKKEKEEKEDLYYSKFFNWLERKIARRELTICETCISYFKYIPRKRQCDNCLKKKGEE